MDGTLVDTDPYWIAAEHHIVESNGGSWSQEKGEAIVGTDLLDGAEIMRREGGIDLPAEMIVEQLLEHVTAGVRRRLDWRPGARELLAGLRSAAVPMALVTMSYKGLAHAVLEHLPRGTFDAVITGDEVTRGKPHPEPYLTAAAALGIDPATAIAIEDSPTGLTSAQQAGCITVAVPHTAPIDPRSGVMVVSSLTELGGVDGLRALAAEALGAAAGVAGFGFPDARRS